MMRRLTTLALLCLSLAACGTTQMAMPYSPAVPPVVQPGAQPAVAVGTVVDRREDGKEDANWVGTIRGGYGNPLKRLETPEPVTEVVRKAFTDALAARGLLAQGAPRYLLNIEVQELNSTQYGRREATVQFRIGLVAPPGAAPIYMDQERTNMVDGYVFTLAAGAFGSVEDLHRVVSQTMNQAIDKVLDKPGLVAAIR